jgi:hypothetical protein
MIAIAQGSLRFRQKDRCARGPLRLRQEANENRHAEFISASQRHNSLQGHEILKQGSG